MEDPLLQEPAATRALHALRGARSAGVSSGMLSMVGISREVLDSLVTKGWIVCHEGEGFAPDHPRSGGVQNDLYMITPQGVIEANKRPRA